MIEHTVAFTLKHAADSIEEKAFLDDMRVFAEIPGVQDFRVNRQVSAKGPFAFQISMWFDDVAALEEYDAHDLHVGFVNDRWIPEVSQHQTLDLLEI